MGMGPGGLILRRSEVIVVEQTGGTVYSDTHRALAEISGYYAIIPEELLLSGNHSAIVLYGVLDRIASKGEGYASLPKLCERTHSSEATVRRARKFLVDGGWLIITSVGTGHLATDYWLPFQTTLGRGAKTDTPGVAPGAYQTEPSNRDKVTKTKVYMDQPPLADDTWPEWFQTLSQDPRWTGNNPGQYVREIEKEFVGVNLNLEAHGAYEWLQTKEGQKKKVLRGFWRNWLKNSLAGRQASGRGGPQRAPDNRTAAELRQGWGMGDGTSR